MDIIYNIIQHFSNNWREYKIAGLITGFLLLSAVAGNYDGKEIESKIKKRNLEHRITKP
jgi:hypothetical protein